MLRHRNAHWAKAPGQTVTHREHGGRIQTQETGYPVLPTDFDPRALPLCHLNPQTSYCHHCDDVIIFDDTV